MTIVKGNLSYTHNLGNFRSVKADAGIEDDVRPGETVDAAFDRIFAKIEDQLVKRITKAVEELG